MALSLSTADRAFLRRKTVAVRLLAEFRLATGTVRATDHTDAIVWGGHTWTGMGQIATVSSRTFSGGMSFSGLSIEINGAGLATPDDPSGAILMASILNDAAPLDPVIVRLWTGTGPLARSARACRSSPVCCRGRR
jgi:hypothetical protein